MSRARKGSKETQYKGKISIEEYRGNHHIILEMPRPPGEAGMFGIVEYLFRPWLGKNVIINIKEDSGDSESDEKNPPNPPIDPASEQFGWIVEFRQKGMQRE